MSETTTVTTRAAPPLALTSLSDYKQLAELMAPMFGGAPMCVLKLMAGASLGFDPYASLTGVHVIEGKTSLGSHLIASAIKKSDKYDYEVVERDGVRQTTDSICEVEFFERVASTGGLSRKFNQGWKSAGRLRYTIEDAQRKGWHVSQSGKLKGPWEKTPRNMLFARVIVDGYKTYCPDLYGGALVYDPDELDTAPPPLDAEYTVSPAANGAHAGEAAEPDPRAVALARTEAARQERYGRSDPNAQAPVAQEAPPATISPEQHATLSALVRQKGRTPAEVYAMLASVGVPILERLPAAQASWAATILTDGQVDSAQCDRISQLVKDQNLNWVAFDKRLKEKYGVARLRMLSKPQADEVEKALKSKATVAA